MTVKSNKGPANIPHPDASGKLIATAFDEVSQYGP